MSITIIARLHHAIDHCDNYIIASCKQAVSLLTGYMQNNQPLNQRHKVYVQSIFQL